MTLTTLTLAAQVHAHLDELGVPRELELATPGATHPADIEERLAWLGSELANARIRIEQLEGQNRALRVGTRDEQRWTS